MYLNDIMLNARLRSDPVVGLIAWMARRNFTKGMAFRDEDRPAIPVGQKDRACLLYVHVPFCEKLCPYCSFNRIIFDEALCKEYFIALRKEIKLYRDRGFNFRGIYVGGGTPTVMIHELAEMLTVAKDCFAIREISVETNPNHLTDSNLRILKQLGVNRLSVGVQSFDNDLLKAMDRYEKYGDGASIAARLKEIGGIFDTLNIDMIYNFAGQTAETLHRDIDIVLGTDIDQVTYYPLMVSTMTRQLMQTTLGPVSQEREKKFYRTIVNRLVPPYRYSSVWCFSRKEAMVDEYIAGYEDYAGLGSGSIGYLFGTCYANTFSIREYIDRVNKGEIPVMASRAFSLRDQARYDFLMKLFAGCFDLRAMKKKYGWKLDWYLADMLFVFQLAGAISCDYKSDRYYLTPRGRYHWVAMMREFFTAVNNFRDFCRENK